ncbi:hypothetical protein IAD21_02219 [Abditibacteriota bacterium]|nr:hypothetical protein IAD21_02219 [Abditibacteriota bacterium]
MFLAGAFGVVLAITTLSLTLRVAVANGIFAGQQRVTRDYIVWMARSVNDYHRTRKMFPPDLHTVWLGELNQPPLVDAWKRPLIYSVRNNQLFIESLGRDGVRGGVGLDADLSNLNLHPAKATLPLGQQLEQPLGHTFAIIAIVCGMIAAGIVFPTLGRVPVNSQSWGWLALQLGGTFFLATLMAGVGALFIAAAHIPSGH